MLENPRAARVKVAARLANKSDRQASGLFLLEGPQAVTEALRYRPELIEALFVTPTALERYQEIGTLARDFGLTLTFATEDVISAMADTVTPQGVTAVCRQFPVSTKEIFSWDLRLVVLLEEVRDPGNAGTIIRVADAVGADAVILTGRSVDLYNPKVVRSTTGSLFHIPVSVNADLTEVVASARRLGLQVIAADVKGGDINELRSNESLNKPTAWVFGNEARGLSDQVLADVDRVVRVPIYGRAESLNLATAASVCLYESAFAMR